MRRSVPFRVVGGIVTTLVLAAVAAFLVFGRDDGGNTAVSPEVVETLSVTLAALGPVSGDSDIDQMRSLLGPPDAFALALEPRDNGAPVRREEWYYYELDSVFEFADGKLVANLPLDENQGLLVVPLQYDPDQFLLGSTWDEVSRVLRDPAVFQAFELEDEFELGVTYYLGEQLLLAFDAEGFLFYVEALPLEAELVQ